MVVRNKMKGIIIGLVIILILLIAILYVFLYIKGKLKKVSQELFNTTSINGIKDAINKSEVAEMETPKSVSSMESLIVPNLNKDFPDLNINEIRRMVEEAIINCFRAIEDRSTEGLNCSSNIVSWINSKISDNGDKQVNYDDIKFHQTLLSKYEKKNGVATLYFQTSLEYNEIIEGNRKKIQDRYRVEFIYIIDANQVTSDQKGLGLNCPNCGAPIQTLGEKYCVYCGSGIKEIVKKSWTLNNIEKY